MKNLRIVSLGIMAALICYLSVGNPLRLWAQATTGYTSIGTSTTTSFTTAALVNGASYNFEVTAVNAAGESTPSNIVTVAVPATGSHTATLTWTAPATDATHSAAVSYNIYDQVVTVPNRVGALTVVVN